MRLPEIESPVRNISAHPSVEPRVPRIAIVGAGFVGSTTAFALMMSGMAAEIVLIDRDSRRAEGHINDLRDAAVFSHTTRIFVGDFLDCCWSARLEMCQWRRETLDKESPWDEGSRRPTSAAMIDDPLKSRGSSVRHS